MSLSTYPKYRLYKMFRRRRNPLLEAYYSISDLITEAIGVRELVKRQPFVDYSNASVENSERLSDAADFFKSKVQANKELLRSANFDIDSFKNDPEGFVLAVNKIRDNWTAHREKLRSEKRGSENEVKRNSIELLKRAKNRLGENYEKYFVYGDVNEGVFVTCANTPTRSWASAHLDNSTASWCVAIRGREAVKFWERYEANYVFYFYNLKNDTSYAMVVDEINAKMLKDGIEAKRYFAELESRKNDSKESSVALSLNALLTDAEKDSEWLKETLLKGVNSLRPWPNTTTKGLFNGQTEEARNGIKIYLDRYKDKHDSDEIIRFVNSLQTKLFKNQYDLDGASDEGDKTLLQVLEALISDKHFNPYGTNQHGRSVFKQVVNILNFKSMFLFIGDEVGDAREKRVLDALSRLIEKSLDNGVDFEQEGFKEYNILFPLICCGKLNLCKKIIKNGANVNARDNKGRTLLIRTLSIVFNEEKTLNVCRMLVNVGADVNISEETENGDASTMGYTPLHYAIRARLPEVVEFLLDNGANQDIVSKNGDTPMSLAQSIERQYEDNTFVSLLISRT